MKHPQKKTVLITVKAYPNPSSSYGETVCCAGIDINTSEWVRLYPIAFRDLENNKRFKKYSVVEIACAKADKDHRPESFHVDSDSITVKEEIDTKKGWVRRKEIEIGRAHV